MKYLFLIFLSLASCAHHTEDYKEGVRSVIRANLKKFGGCYSKYLGQGKTGSGKIDLKWSTKADGSVISEAVATDDIKDEKLNACMLATLKGLHFPPSPDGKGTIEITFPFYFALEKPAKK